MSRRTCNRDCFSCPYDDCVMELASAEELRQSRELDEEIKQSRMPELTNLTFERTGKRGRPRKRVTAKETAENRERQREYARQYYISHREEILEKQRAWSKEYYQKNREKILEKSRKERIG